MQDDVNGDYVGADIANFVNLAATEVIKKGEERLTTKELQSAITSISLGRVRKSVHLAPETIRVTAVHESGHAIVAAFTENAKKISQMTVLPRGSSLGSTSFRIDDDSEFSVTREELIASIDVGKLTWALFCAGCHGATCCSWWLW